MTLPYSPVVHIGGAALAVVLLCLFAFRRPATPKHRQPPN